MGVPAFYRWLSEKYPKIVSNVLEDRVHLAHASGTTRQPFDSTRPNPSGLECDNLYIDMNGIIHPCSHPENGPQPQSEAEMYINVCHYVDRLFRAVRPRKLLYLAIDGVAPRAKMNQQRARRFRSAQEARELKETEEDVKQSLRQQGYQFEQKNNNGANSQWDSNVITPGTQFMTNLSTYIRFYIRKRISTDKAWKQVMIIFSDASIPGEGEHKIMTHIRHQRSHPNYDPNLVHVLHGLDADLIMLALATHETQFYILREEVIFGRKGAESSMQRKLESGYYDAQKQLDELAGEQAMLLPENKHKPLERLSIPILREYLEFEFSSCRNLPFRGEVSFERVIDDIVFLCFFVGNDFLPHLPSLDIRDGALDYLFNVYKTVLPTLGDYITSHGGNVNLSHVDVILSKVASIEDYVFNMKHENEVNDKKRREEQAQNRKNNLTRNGLAPKPNFDTTTNSQNDNQSSTVVRGRAARILENRKLTTLSNGAATNTPSASDTGNNGTLNNDTNNLVALGRKSHFTSATNNINSNPTNNSSCISKSLEENAKAAYKLKEALLQRGLKNESNTSINTEENQVSDQSVHNNYDANSTIQNEDNDNLSPNKRKAESIENTSTDNPDDDIFDNEVDDTENNDVDETDTDAIDIEKVVDQEALDEATKVLKMKVKEAEQKKLNNYAENVKDNVRLHEAGWKDRYYSDKCKADDIEEYGGREHLFKSYVMGLCWVMKYYYDGCPSWKWYYPFHYAPFASDLRNIERFSKDCSTFDLAEPFKPVEQLMAVLPNDSSHAIPKASRWLMSDPESPIIDFYPRDIKCDPNGKAMPWLWVVLLPFIDEERLLDAMRPTLAKWTDAESFCNSRGLDDGYVYCHVTHPLASAVTEILDATEKTKKFHIQEMTEKNTTLLAGEIRQPLSNEMYPLDKVSSIDPPATKRSQLSSDVCYDDLFTSPIDMNAALCGAFTELPKSTHKSVILRGAIIPNPVLTDEDRRIRRPRLNRMGGTICNLGSQRDGNSYQSGYGSMNINTYERDLAERTGRGHQMQQTGTRSWGAMEPVQKRQRFNNSQSQSTHQPYVTSNNSFQQQSQSYRPPSNVSRWQPPPNAQTQNTSFPMQQNRQQSNNNFNPQINPPLYHLPPPPPPPPIPPQYSQHHHHQQQQGFSFRGHASLNQNRTQGQFHPPPQHHQQQQQNNKASSGINQSTMNSLRSQLARTLNQNRNGKS